MNSEVMEPEVLEPEVLEPEQEAKPVRRPLGHRRRFGLPNRKGMTLVEIMIVLTILAGIMVTVGVVAFDQLKKANIKTTQVKLRKLSGQIQQYYAFQTPPALPESLQDLVNPPGNEGSYVKDTDLKDAWGNDILYEKSGSREYKVISAGPDGSSGTEDDIEFEE
jgi:general secretion pathway protein G